MSRDSLRRPLALLALALALFAALPCAAIPGDDACCGGAGARCADEAAAPCAQLAATLCCEAGGAPVEVTVTGHQHGAPTVCPIFRVELPAELRPLASHVPPPQRGAEIALRSVVLRL